MAKPLAELVADIAKQLLAIVSPTARAVVDVDTWDGAASNYSSTDAYCEACLIDVNGVAGREERVQSHCKLPVRREGDPPGTFVRQAVYAAAGGRGITAVTKPDDVPQEAWDTAVEQAANQLVRAYDEMDETPPTSILALAGVEERAISLGRVWDQLAAHFYENDYMDYSTYPIDLYWDRGVLYLIMSSNGRLLRAELSIEDDRVMVGEAQEVVENFIPVTSGGEERAISRAIRLPDGRVRVVVIAATAVLNRSGQIDGTPLFDDFVERAHATGVYPTVNFHHYPQIRLGEADFVAREGWCYLVSYVFDDTPIGRAAGDGYMANPDYWGHSIEFLSFATEPVVVGDVEITAHTRGVNTGLAILSEQLAASLFTNRGVATDAMEERMNKATQDDLQRLVGEELAQQTAQTVDRTNQQIEEDGLVRRSQTDDAQTDETQVDETAVATDVDESQVDETQVDETEEEALVEFEIDDALVDVLADRLADRFGDPQTDTLAEIAERMNQMVERLNRLSVMEERVAKLERAAQARQEAVVADTPQVRAPQVTRVTYRPSMQNHPVTQNRNGRLQGLDGDDFDSIAQDTLDSLPPLRRR